MRRAAARDGVLPAVCVLTGQPAQRYQRVTFTYVPGWTWVLLLFGIIPCLIARWFTAEKIPTALPISERARRDYRRRRDLTMATVVAGIALVIVGGASQVPGIALAGLGLLLLAALAMLVLGLWFIAVEPAPDPEFLVIRRAHPRFAAAVGH